MVLRLVETGKLRIVTVLKFIPITEAKHGFYQKEFKILEAA